MPDGLLPAGAVCAEGAAAGAGAGLLLPVFGAADGGEATATIGVAGGWRWLAGNTDVAG